MPRTWAALVFLAVFVGPTTVLADGPATRANTAVFEEAWMAVAKEFYDPKMHGVNWEEARAKLLPKLAEARDQADVHALILQLLATLKASHLTLIEGDVYEEHVASEFEGRMVPTMGVDLVADERGLFVAGLANGGAGAIAGLRRGDRIVAIDGIAADASPALRPGGSDPGIPGSRGFFLSPKEGLKLTIERRPKAGEKGVFELRVEPTRWNMIAASRASTTIIERQGLRMGYVHLFHLANFEVVKDLKKALLGPLRRCHGLVLDLRGRGGTPENVDGVLELFKENSPYSVRWTRPVVALIDRGTRSAKEVLAFHLKREKFATLIGQKTQGAVLGAKFNKLRDGSYLMIPEVDMRALSLGIPLEGRGVSPNIEVEDSLLWADGRDPIFERGVDELFWMIWSAYHQGREHGFY